MFFSSPGKCEQPSVTTALVLCPHCASKSHGTIFKMMTSGLSSPRDRYQDRGKIRELGTISKTHTHTLPGRAFSPAPPRMVCRASAQSVSLGLGAEKEPEESPHPTFQEHMVQWVRKNPQSPQNKPSTTKGWALAPQQEGNRREGWVES